MRVELIEVAPFPNSIRKVDTNEALYSRDVGHYHICLDMSRACTSLHGFLIELNRASIERYQRTVRVVVAPSEAPAGALVPDARVEFAMIADADGNVVELMRYLGPFATERAVKAADDSAIYPWQDPRTRFMWDDMGSAF